MRIIKAWLLAVAIVVAISSPALARSPLTGALADYVTAKDDSYAWTKRSEGTVLTCKYAELILTSQTWRGIPWKHQLFILKPAQIDPAAKHAVMMIAGGNWNEKIADPATELKLPGEAKILALLAESLKTPVAILLHVPQQPIFEGKREDQIIAYTFREFIKSGDPTWPLLAPMAKSAVKAMDATSEAMKKEWDLDIGTYTITGASKRGWTTWLTGAVDDRAVAIAPMVIDMLNMSEHMPLQKASFGGQASEQIDDYQGLDKLINTPRGLALRKIVDPWEYRERLTQPKLIMLGTNDRYWPLEACNLYWHGLEGDKYLIYVPNNGHGLEDRGRLVAGLNALNRSVMTGKPLPKLTWSFNDVDAGTKLHITSDTPVSKAQLWMATAPTMDFRDAKWTTTEDTPGGKDFSLNLPPKSGVNSAYFAELIFHEGTDDQFSLSTNVKVLRNDATATGGGK
jgi:PhoPQ-activated pathogenicity-related protein